MMDHTAFILPRGTVNPGMDPPKGVTPNFIDPISRARYCIIAQTLVLTIATLFVAMRMYSKLRITRSPGWDDYTIVFAWLLSIAYSGVGLSQLQYGLGVHQWDLPIEDVIRMRRLSNVEQIIYPMLIFIVKISILLLYRRIFAPSHRTKIIIGTIAAILFLFYFSNMIVKIFICIPREAIWDKRVKGRCVNPHVLYLVTAVVNVISDFYLLLLPLPAIWHLHIPLMRKIGLMLAFSAGSFACITSIIRLAETIKHLSAKDFTWEIVSIHLWALVEINIGIACACMPALPSFYHHFFPKRQKNVKGSFTKDSYVTRRTNPTVNLGGDEPHLMQGKYLELGETTRPMDEPSVIYSSIRAEGNGRCKETGGPNMCGPDAGILRTIDVEQSVSDGSGAGGSREAEIGPPPTTHHITSNNPSSR